MIEDVKKDAAERMGKCVAALRNELKKLRTGRANTSLLEHVRVDYYGSEVPLQQVANVAVEDSRTLTVVPWEKQMVPAIEKAIMKSDLGLNPATAGSVTVTATVTSSELAPAVSRIVYVRLSRRVSEPSCRYRIVPSLSTLATPCTGVCTIVIDARSRADSASTSLSVTAITVSPPSATTVSSSAARGASLTPWIEIWTVAGPETKPSVSRIE